MQNLGEPLEEGELETLLAKASYENKLFEEAPGDQAKQLRLLKREYAFELLDIDGTVAQASRIQGET